MIVDNVVENDDGTADIDLHLNAEEVKMLIQEGLISLLSKYIEEEEVAKRTPALLKAKYGKPDE